MQDIYHREYFRTYLHFHSRSWKEKQVTLQRVHIPFYFALFKLWQTRGQLCAWSLPCQTNTRLVCCHNSPRGRLWTGHERQIKMDRVWKKNEFMQEPPRPDDADILTYRKLYTLQWRHITNNSTVDLTCFRLVITKKSWPICAFLIICENRDHLLCQSNRRPLFRWSVDSQRPKMRKLFPHHTVILISRGKWPASMYMHYICTEPLINCNPGASFTNSHQLKQHWI